MDDINKEEILEMLKDIDEDYATVWEICNKILYIKNMDTTAQILDEMIKHIDVIDYDEIVVSSKDETWTMSESMKQLHRIYLDFLNRELQYRLRKDKRLNDTKEAETFTMRKGFGKPNSKIDLPL